MRLILKKCLNQWHDLGNDRFDLPFGFKAQLSGVIFHMVSPAPAPPSNTDTNLMLDQVTRAAFCVPRQVSSYIKLYQIIPSYTKLYQVIPNYTKNVLV